MTILFASSSRSIGSGIIFNDWCYIKLNCVTLRFISREIGFFFKFIIGDFNITLIPASKKFTKLLKTEFILSSYYDLNYGLRPDSFL